MTGDEQLGRAGGSSLPFPACPYHSLPVHDTPSLFPSVPAHPRHRLGEPEPRAPAEPRGGRGALEAPVAAAALRGRYRLHSGSVPCNRRSPRARSGPVRSPPRRCRCHPP